MEVLRYTGWGLELLFFSYILVQLVYNSVFSFSGLFYKKVRFRQTPKYYNRILVLTPAYMEDNVILAVARRLLKQDYPSDKFAVMVIADKLQPQTLNSLRALPIIVKEVSFEKSTKAASLKKAVEDLPDNAYDIALTLDADNFLEDRFLYKINDQFIEGHKAIQGRRLAKNLNTSFAILDGLSEHINNHIHRKGPDALGFSANLIGSGMAFDFVLFKELIAGNNAVGGFDRELQLSAIDRKVRIKYLDDALVYDEKIENPNAFGAQRKRWLASQVFYLRKNFRKGLIKLLKGDFAYFRFAVLNNLLLPNMLFLAATAMALVLSLAFQEFVLVPYRLWGAIFALSMIAFASAIPREFVSWKYLRAMFALPVAFFVMLKSALSIKGANRTFIHTPHSHVEIQK